jgi:hypothetical protein
MKLQWEDEAKECRKHPNEWAKLFTAPDPQKAAMLASNIRTGQRKAFQGNRKLGESWDALADDCDVWVTFQKKIDLTDQEK